jgi:hypothetical protein
MKNKPATPSGYSVPNSSSGPLIDWDKEFGNLTIVTWVQFINFMKRTNKLPYNINEEEEVILRYVLDYFNSGYVTKTKFNEYTKGFGIGPSSLQNVQ